MESKIKLVRLNAVVPFGPGPGVREVSGSAPGVSIELSPGLLVLTKRLRDASGEKLYRTQVPLAQATSIVYEPEHLAPSAAPLQQQKPSVPPPLLAPPLPLEPPAEPKGEIDDPEEPEDAAPAALPPAPKPAAKKAAKKAAEKPAS